MTYGIKSSKASTAMIIARLVEHPEGLTSNELSDLMGLDLTGRLSKLFDLGDVERSLVPRPHVKTRYLYKAKLPQVTAPPAADVESSSVASQPVGVE